MQCENNCVLFGPISGSYSSIISRKVFQHFDLIIKGHRQSSNGKPFSGILLTVNFNHQFYSTIPLLDNYFRPVFDKVIYCGPEESSKYDVVVIEGPRTYFGYMCLAIGIKKYPNYKGYLYINDDMIVNWWNMIRTPLDKIWYGKDIVNEAGADMHKDPPCCWHWWSSAKALENCKNAFHLLQGSSSKWNGSNFLKTYFKNTEGAHLCLRAWSDFFYIPKRLSGVFHYIASEFYKNRVFLEVAVSTMLTMLDEKKNIVNLDGVYLPDLYGDVDFSDGKIVSKIYDTKKSFYHPVKLSVPGEALELFKNVAIKMSESCLKLYSNNTEYGTLDLNNVSYSTAHR